MKRNIVIFSMTLILTGLLGFSAMSLAQVAEWKRKADMPTPRSDLSLSVVDGLIYAFGGRDGKLQERFTTVEAYNPATDTWQKVTDMPIARDLFSTSVVNGKIYLFGGYTPVERRGKKIVKQLKTVEVYHPAADAWEQKADAPTARKNISTAVLNGKIYVIGGGTNVGGGEDLVEIYDPATDTWTQGANMIGKRWLGPSTSVVNGKIYAIGGYRKENHKVEIVEAYHPATDTWTRKKDVPTPRFYAGVHAPAAGGKIYVIGGYKGLQVIKTVEELRSGHGHLGAEDIDTREKNGLRHRCGEGEDLCDWRRRQTSG